jgi:DNA processing protein
MRAWLALLRNPSLSPPLGARLLHEFGGPAAVLAAGTARWRALGCSEALCESLARPDWNGVEQDERWLQQPQRQLIPLNDARYPPLLHEIADPPLALFAHGDARLLGQPQLAVVGARNATPQGLDNARAFAGALARAGLVVTSGLALGIDGAAHQGALDAAGATIAVCGNGLDRVYPARHRELAHRIAGSGLLLSELPTGIAPRPENFPRRNRIISGLALGTLVIEAAPGSGSLITARLAAEQGREVFAVPGSIHNPLARGCHALLRDGAHLVETVDDVLREVAPQLAATLRAQSLPASAVADAAAAEPQRDEDPRRARLLAALGDELQPFDRLIARTGLPPGELQALLLELEMDGALAAGPGDTFMRRVR